MTKILRVSFSFLFACLLLGIIYFLLIVPQKDVYANTSTMEGSIVVNTFADELINDGDCSLREAIEAANNNTPVDNCGTGEAITDTITFGVAGTITISWQLGELAVLDGGAVVIEGGEAITLTGMDFVRIFHIDSGADLTLEALSIVHGNELNGGAIYNKGTVKLSDINLSDNWAQLGGGGVYNAIDATINITNSMIINNHSGTGSGGGIYNGGSVHLTNSTLAMNDGAWGGGAIENGGEMYVISSTIQENSAAGGGGIENGSNGWVTIVASTISNNTAIGYSGGGIHNYGTVYIVNSTVSGNEETSDKGGGIANWGMVIITNTTLADNSAATLGGAIYNQPGDGVTIAANSIIAYSPSGGNCAGDPIIDDGNNIEDTNVCGLELENNSWPDTDPLLGPLEDNGGPTWTRALLAGSPAIDEGNDAKCPRTDQRGILRPLEGNGDGLAVCDIGSYEFEFASIFVTTLEDELNSDGDCSLREAIVAANTNEPVDTCGTGDVSADTIGFDVAGIIAITDPLTVTDSGPLIVLGTDVITIDGGDNVRIFLVEPDAELTLDRLVLNNGHADLGGAVYNMGTLNIENSSLYHNHAVTRGGGIFSQGVLTVIGSTVEGNTASNCGGMFGTGEVNLTNTTVINNGATGACGGIGVSSGTLMLINSTIESNNAQQGGGLALENATVSIIDSEIVSNTASSAAGGGIWSQLSTISIAGGSVSGNMAGSVGGGIYHLDGTLVIDFSTFTGNAGTEGGGIYNDTGPAVSTFNSLGVNITSKAGIPDFYSVTMVTNSTVWGNHSSVNGGGIYNHQSTMSIINSTLSGNNSSNGGGINNYYGTLAIKNSTLSNNDASALGGGIANNYGTLVIYGSIVANNLAGDCYAVGEITDDGYNISSDGTCGFNIDNHSMPNTDPIIGPLQDNGGPTLTHALQENSPAIDNGDNAQCPTADQRGIIRPIDGNWDGLAVCDIGSFEYIYTSLYVTTLIDELNNDGDCSLREAIEAANTNASVDACGSGSVFTDTITFGVVGTITVSNQISVAASGPLMINGHDVITTSGGEDTRVWWVDSGSEVTFSHLAMINGESVEGGSIYNNLGKVAISSSNFSDNQGDEGGVIYNFGTIHITDTVFAGNNARAVGGSILNDGIMTITNSSFNGNTSYFSSGAIDNWGTLSITNCTFSGNISTAGPGGAISGGSMTIVRSTFEGNSATAGGGIVAGDDTTIIESTFTGNVAGWGGGIAGGYEGMSDITIINSTIWGNSASLGGGYYSDGNTTIINSTISGNEASTSGGGIYAAYNGFTPSTLFLTYSTISGNAAPSGGGVYNRGNTTLSSSIIANNPSGSDCQINAGFITDAGHNLDSDGSCGLNPELGSLPSTDPQLGALEDNGGPTLTHALMRISPAVDAGDNGACPGTDQRGMPRPVDGNGDGTATCDIGSFELEALVIPSYQQFLPVVNKSP